MRKLRLIAPLLVLAALIGSAAPSAHAQSGITKDTIYQDGPDTRYLLGGQWLFRLDTAGQGLTQGFQRQTSKAGWTPKTVPDAWNAGDNSVASMTGTTGWYRKDFTLPDKRARMDWVIRFESVNYRSRIWLNGKPVGRNTGAYLPFEVRLPRSVLKRRGTNRLVIRVDNRRLRSDFPPSGLTGSGDPAGGWWNYGGLLREVYLERIDAVQVTNTLIRPVVANRSRASVLARMVVRNYSNKAQKVRITGKFGNKTLRLGTRTVGPKKFASFSDRVNVANPKLWAPGSPNLYDVSLTVRSGKRKVVGWKLKSGIRTIKVINGKLTINGRAMNIRGVGLHEDSPDKGFAIDSARRKQIVAQAQELGATVLRSHYPLHPEIHELADRAGLLVWSEIPVYAVKTQYLKRLEVRKLAAKELEANITANQNHPSVMLWSIGNELSARPGPVQSFYINRAVRQAKQLDPTRPVALVVAGYPSAGCRPQYANLDVVGVNDYFGWYPGPNGQIADRDSLSDYLDSVRACYPNKALFVSEFGAEANRDGPVEEKGTFAYQQDFVNFHLGVYAQKPWLSGAIYWAIQEFRVRPNWDGGNPRPESPIHQKGLLKFLDGAKKPAWFDMQRNFKGTQQIAP